MVCIGPGPGPKNVLAEDIDGCRVVVPYMIWKHKLKGEQMADSDKLYGSAEGFIQFEVEEREANGATVRDVTIRRMDTQELLRITVWPELAGIDLVEGDWIAVDGSITFRDVETDHGTKTYTNMSAYNIVRLAGAERDEEEAPVTKKSKPKSTGRKSF